ncbi:acyl-CoA dehydrogenase family protein [Rhodococcus koreensis]|uniref:Acyl-CoA dehydrogenase, C-terminal domain n=1 Tax=Rhodococcus koreensis TaxID=99653 RepID=A0A1H4KYP7_9NOCA|nr:acyl-CoA dehydrogenase family protein [Rhodococcus koreensis]SEB63336.1 Acyl-CoA dehydrogenase, C-terminal domain [Rhodococcus koreensis]
MTWRGPRLRAEEEAIVDLFARLAGDRGQINDGQPAVADALRAELGGLGLWMIDDAEDDGNPQRVSQLVLSLIGRSWPALGWACAQTRAALTALDAGPTEAREHAEAVRSGSQVVVAVDAAAMSVRLDRNDTSYVGTIHRVDPASALDSIVLLDGDEAVWLASPTIQQSSPVRRSGLDGARTVSVGINGAGISLGNLADEVRSSAWLGAAAVATGIASAAVDQAVDYARHREQFGGPLTDLPVIRATLQRQAALVASSVAAALEADASDVSQAAGVLATACDAAVEVSAAALQVHGGYGYLTEYPAEQWVRDSLSLRAAADAMQAGIRAGRVLAQTNYQEVPA